MGDTIMSAPTIENQEGAVLGVAMEAVSLYDKETLPAMTEDEKAVALGYLVAIVKMLTATFGNRSRTA